MKIDDLSVVAKSKYQLMMKALKHIIPARGTVEGATGILTGQ